jgi:hypothetical protein
MVKAGGQKGIQRPTGAPVGTPPPRVFSSAIADDLELARRLLVHRQKRRLTAGERSAPLIRSRGGLTMKAYVVFSSSEPILIATRQTIRSNAVLDQLDRVGIHKFIAREAPVSRLRSRYGRQFEVIEDALNTGGTIRVLDYSGRRIFQNLPFSELGLPYRHDIQPTPGNVTKKPRRSGNRPDLGSMAAQHSWS